MILRYASAQDIDSIMAIEKSSFIPAIQEKQTVFESRIAAFPHGFIIFEDRQTHSAAGYLCSERWESIPASDVCFTLGHSAKKTHTNGGKILYLSSFALLPLFRGKGSGKALFGEALDFILACEQENPIQTILLLVNEEWKGAFHIYETAGFTTLRTIDGIFPGHKGILMKKDIYK